MGFYYGLGAIGIVGTLRIQHNQQKNTTNKDGTRNEKFRLPVPETLFFFSLPTLPTVLGCLGPPLVPCPTRAVSSDACTDTGYGSCLSSRGDEAKQSKSPSLNLQRKATHPLIHSSTTRVHDLERRDNTAVIHAAF